MKRNIKICTRKIMLNLVLWDSLLFLLVCPVSCSLMFYYVSLLFPDLLQCVESAEAACLTTCTISIRASALRNLYLCCLLAFLLLCLFSFLPLFSLYLTMFRSFPCVQSMHNWWSGLNTCMQMLLIMSDLRACSCLPGMMPAAAHRSVVISWSQSGSMSCHVRS